MPKAPTKPSVFVGISGGVDSAVSAHWLIEEGYDVHGVFMQNWDADDPHCTAQDDLSMAKRVCDQLHIPLEVVNFSQDYWDRVFQIFLDEYTQGRTPNPDVLCNKEIKFKAFLDHAMAHGCHHIATGHYASVKEQDGQHQLHAGVDPDKDQSYFLCLLNQTQLSHAIMPLGSYHKQAIREKAKALGLQNWDRKDSTGICFIGERKFKDFLENFVLCRPGTIVSDEGKTLGEHQGLMFYTIGQRQGLHIGGTKEGKELPWFVIKKDMPSNTLVVGQGHEHPALLSRHLSAKDMHWINDAPTQYPFHCQARIRHRQPLQQCVIESDGATIHVEFEEPQRAIASGQMIALYHGSHCLGGGVIDRSSN